jgi:hypothetical protein
VPLSIPAWRSAKLTLRRNAKPAPVPSIR